MVDTEPKVNATSRYSIKAVATYLGVSTRTVQRYIAAGDMKAQTRKANSKRFVTGIEILRVWNQIY